jgi:glucose/arabinose dehydrogenase
LPSAGDPQGNGQSINAVLGKLLRIDPSGDAFPADPLRNYKIPPGNPYAAGGGAPEWWARGVRNPWRFTFDRLTGDLYIGDVGQDTWEEVDFISAAERAAPPAGGFNLGWNVCEGTHDYAGNCAAHASRKPQIEYPHDPTTGGFAVTGGYAYRGDRLPSLYGTYLYAGQRATNPPFVETASGVSFVGSDSVLSNQFDDNSVLAFQIDPGDAPLNPRMTRLRTLPSWILK